MGKVKRVIKDFRSFADEEKWLKEMAEEGWRLLYYDSEETDSCYYKFEKDPEASKYNYQIDYRKFKNKSEYEEYKQLFEDAGWSLLSKSYKFNKHIFVSTSKEKIFSDSTTSLEREIQRYRTMKLYSILSILYVVSVMFVGVYFDIDMSYLGGLGTFGVMTALYTIPEALKRRKYIKNVNAQVS